MRNLIRLAPLALATLIPLAAACGGVIDNDNTAENNLLGGIGLGRPIPPVGGVLEEVPALDQSFLHFENWGNHFAGITGWSSALPVLTGRINADAKADLVAFAPLGVYVGLSAGDHFDTFQQVVTGLGSADGWTTTDTVRLLGDINGDGVDDIVAFGYDGVWTALNNGSGGFGPANFVVADLGYNSGWRVDKHTRLLANVNSDKCKDIVGFGDAGVYVALSNCAGSFGPVSFVVNELGADQGWSPARNLRTTTDLNGDGREDIVAFGDAGVWTALSDGTGFAAPHFVLAGFAANNGWGHPTLQLTLADVNADGRKDIVGTAANAVYTARSTGDGGFGAVSKAYASPAITLEGATVADFNGDGYADVLVSIVYSPNTWTRLLGGPSGFHDERLVLVRGDYGRQLIADVDGNGMPDVVILSTTSNRFEWVARSTSAAPTPLAAPTNLQMTTPTSAGFTLSWVDNSSDEMWFSVKSVGSGPGTSTAANMTQLNSSLLGPLQPNTQYCFHVRAESDLGYSDWSPQVCGTTSAAPPPPTQTSTMTLNKAENWDPGNVVWKGVWTPQGRTIVGFRSGETSTYGATLLFIKPGYNANNCSLGNIGVVALPPTGSMTKAQVDQITWNVSSPPGSVAFVACDLPGPWSPTNIPDILNFNLDYHQ